MSPAGRKSVVSIIGNASLPKGDPRIDLAFQTGRKLVDNGFAVMTGGMGGVMDAALQGARSSSSWTHGNCIAIIPGPDPYGAGVSDHADLVIPTSLDHARNLVVAQADAVIAIGGGAGTLTEISFAWIYRRLVIAMRCEGWSGRLADTRIDDRVRYRDIPDDRVYGAGSAEEGLSLITRLLPAYRRRHRGITAR